MATKTKIAVKPDRFAELCAEFPLRPVRTDQQLDAATAIAHAILRKDAATQDEEDYLEVLSVLIHDYERSRHAIDTSGRTGADMLRFLIGTNGRSQAEVARATGIPVSSISEMCTGKRGIGPKHAVALGAYCSVSPTLFLPKVRGPV